MPRSWAKIQFEGEFCACRNHFCHTRKYFWSMQLQGDVQLDMRRVICVEVIDY